MNEFDIKSMNQSSSRPGSHLVVPRHRTHGSARVIVLALVVFLLGLGAGAFWLYRTARPAPQVDIVQRSAGDLSGATKAVLQGLRSPVGIRFYSLLDPATVSAPMLEYAGRVDEVLSRYQRESNGKIKVTRFNSLSDGAANAASADGIKAFNLDKGNACFLGIAVACQDQKESLPHLSVEWEPALESDLTRAIMRVIAANRPAVPPQNESRIDAAVADEVRRLIPNLATVSVRDGTRILQENALAEFAATALEMEAQVKGAEQQIVDAQKSGSAAAQQEALGQLKQVKAQRDEKLKQITARLQVQIAALENIKKK